MIKKKSLVSVEHMKNDYEVIHADVFQPAFFCINSYCSLEPMWCTSVIIVSPRTIQMFLIGSFGIMLNIKDIFLPLITIQKEDVYTNSNKHKNYQLIHLCGFFLKL